MLSVYDQVNSLQVYERPSFGTIPRRVPSLWKFHPLRLLGGSKDESGLASVYRRWAEERALLRVSTSMDLSKYTMKPPSYFSQEKNILNRNPETSSRS